MSVSRPPGFCKRTQGEENVTKLENLSVLSNEEGEILEIFYGKNGWTKLVCLNVLSLRRWMKCNRFIPSALL